MLALSLFSTDASDEDTDDPPSTDRSTSIISEGANIEGIIELSSVDLCIEGTVRGDISTDGRVIVSEGAEIEGTIDARTIRIAGYVEGQIRAEEELILCPPAEVHATLQADVLEIQPGASFTGKVPGKDSSPSETATAVGPQLDSTEIVPGPRSSTDGNTEVITQSDQ